MSNLIEKLPRLAILGAGFSFVAGVFVFGFAYFTVSIPDPNAYVNSQSTIIQYADGSEIGRIGSENRTVVTLAEIPMQVRNAVMAAEDRGFYSNRALVQPELLERFGITYEAVHCKVAQPSLSSMPRPHS